MVVGEVRIAVGRSVGYQNNAISHAVMHGPFKRLRQWRARPSTLLSTPRFISSSMKHLPREAANCLAIPSNNSRSFASFALPNFLLSNYYIVSCRASDPSFFLALPLIRVLRIGLVGKSQTDICANYDSRKSYGIAQCSICVPSNKVSPIEANINSENDVAYNIWMYYSQPI